MKKGVSILLAVCMFSFTILDSVSYAAESIQQESFTSDNISQITEYEGKIEIKDENNTVVQEAYVGQQYKIQIDENFQQDNLNVLYTYYIDMWSDNQTEPSDQAEVIQADSAQNEITYAFDKAGEYAVFVKVEDSEGNTAYLKRAITILDTNDTTVQDVVNGDVESFPEEDINDSNIQESDKLETEQDMEAISDNGSADRALEIIDFNIAPDMETVVGDTVILSADLAGGTGEYEYEFYVIRNGEEILLRSYGSSNTYKWQPFTPAEYTVGVRVKDSSGTVVNKEVERCRSWGYDKTVCNRRKRGRRLPVRILCNKKWARNSTEILWEYRRVYMDARYTIGLYSRSQSQRQQRKGSKSGNR